MTLDVVDVRAFYKTPLGQVTARKISRVIGNIWPDLKGESLLGLGYPLPYLPPYQDQVERVAAFMPAQQGAIPWPDEQPSLTALVNDEDLPLKDESLDRVLVIHSLEQTQHTRPFLREIWRVLKGNGRALFIVPNRRSLWAQLDLTPFGQGQPYTMTQLRTLLRENMFTPVQEARCLYFVPSSSRILLSTNRLFESLGKRFLQKVSGVVCIEAMKQVYAMPLQHSSKRAPILPKLAGI